MSEELFILGIQIIAALCAIIVLLFSIVLHKLWNELCKIRDFRHEDRDLITVNNSKLQIIEFEVDDLKLEVKRRCDYKPKV